MADSKKTATPTEEKTTDSGAVAEESMGKATNETATPLKPEKIKCDKNTSCDDTLPWGSW